MQSTKIHPTLRTSKDRLNQNSTTKQVVAHRVNATAGGGVKAVLHEDNSLLSLARSLGVAAAGVEKFGSDIERGLAEDKQERKQAEREAKYEAEKAARKAEIAEQEDAYQYAVENGYQLVEEAKNSIHDELSKIPLDELNPINAFNTIVKPKIQELSQGASRSYNKALNGVYSKIADTGYKEITGLMKTKRDDFAKKSMIGMLRNPEASIEELSTGIATVRSRFIERGGSEKEFDHEIKKDLVLTEAIQWHNTGDSELFTEHLERLIDAGLIDKDSPDDIGLFNKLATLELETVQRSEEQLKQYAAKATLDAAKLAKGLKTSKEVDKWLDNFTDYAPKDKYEEMWGRVARAALADRRNILHGKEEKYKNVLRFVHSVAASKVKSANIEIGDNTSLDGVSAGVAKTILGTDIVVDSAQLDEALITASEEAVHHAVLYDLDPDSDETKAKFFKIYQDELRKFNINITDPGNALERPYEEWSRPYVADNEENLWGLIKEQVSKRPMTGIVDIVNDVIPEAVPDYQTYRNIFYRKSINEARIQYMKQMKQQFKEVKEGEKARDREQQNTFQHIYNTPNTGIGLSPAQLDNALEKGWIEGVEPKEEEFANQEPFNMKSIEESVRGVFDSYKTDNSSERRAIAKALKNPALKNKVAAVLQGKAVGRSREARAIKKALKDPTLKERVSRIIAGVKDEPKSVPQKKRETIVDIRERASNAQPKELADIILSVKLQYGLTSNQQVFEILQLNPDARQAANDIILQANRELLKSTFNDSQETKKEKEQLEKQIKGKNAYINKLENAILKDESESGVGGMRIEGYNQ